MADQLNHIARQLRPLAGTRPFQLPVYQLETWRRETSWTYQGYKPVVVYGIIPRKSWWGLSFFCKGADRQWEGSCQLLSRWRRIRRVARSLHFFADRELAPCGVVNVDRL